ncbi:serine/threonine-protein kinase BLUS1-like isoform X2 [Momordica charantia]|uniref:Serine/threonine-protein kinase BLUS1-like isoform X2 n=1 Tax=Momordica charantia TaxID=3673 RepID=A0A6J1DGT4_MOMCH|nr:serine/threonine-protein kinase BLUS1-like isoform X2 [Momordica charantia]
MAKIIRRVASGLPCLKSDQKKLVMGSAPAKKYPANSKDYKLYEEVGEGVSATVYRALCVPLNEIVAVKVLDLERCNNDLEGTRREVNTMSLVNHTNILRAHCSFTTGYNLWIVMPYMGGGSCLHIMKLAHPEGLEEPVIAILLLEVLKALVYLHSQGHIHRDVKAGNILIDSNGAVKLADFGVSACIFDTGDRQRSRNTFVGTPCWMAPEVMQQFHGYDFKADIWSFGITALELAHGHAPFSKYPPMKVLLMTLQSAPPGLHYERDKRFSKSFKEMVAACLVKDPKKRPEAEKLLKHPFFKQGHPNEYLVRTLLSGLPSLEDRFKMLKAKEAELLGQNETLYGDKEQLSQKEYVRGVSAWNFNLDDLKSQAALHIQDDTIVKEKDVGVNERQEDEKEFGLHAERTSAEKLSCSNPTPSCEGVSDLRSLESFPASLRTRPIGATNNGDEIFEEDMNRANRRKDDINRTNPRVVDQEFRTKVNYTSNGAAAQLKEHSKASSAGLGRKDPTSSLCTAVSGSLTSPFTTNLSASSLIPSLHCILQQNELQREEIIKSIKYLEQISGMYKESAEESMNDFMQTLPTPASSRERELWSQAIHLHQSTLAEELSKQRLKNAQLERKLNALARKEEVL